MFRGRPVLAASISIGLAIASLASQECPAHAQSAPSAGDDVVYLRNGGMLRGTATEIVPGDHATIALASGQVATVQWAQIDRIERGARAAAPPPVAAPSVRTVTVHIDSERAARLEVRAANGSSWIPLCNAPCDAAVPLVATYRITGDGMRATPPFGLDGAPGGSVAIEIEPASKAGFVGGIVLISASPIVSIVGLFVLVAQSTEHSSSGSTAGIALSLGGLVGVGAGVFLLVGNSSSKETQTVRGLGENPPKTTARREPTWKDFGPVAPAPPQLTVPLFTF